MKKINFSFFLAGLLLVSCSANETTNENTQSLEENKDISFSINIEKTDIKELDEIIRSDFESLKDDFQKDQKSGEFTVETLSNFRDKNMVSVLFGIVVWGSEMPHPNTYFKSYNFNLTDRKLTGFSDFFTLNSAIDSANFVQLLFDNSEITADIVMFDNNNLINNAELSFTQGEVVFSYGDYTFASWSDGTFQVKMSKDKLTKFIKK